MDYDIDIMRRCWVAPRPTYNAMIRRLSVSTGDVWDTWSHRIDGVCHELDHTWNGTCHEEGSLWVLKIRVSMAIKLLWSVYRKRRNKWSSARVGVHAKSSHETSDVRLC